MICPAISGWNKREETENFADFTKFVWETFGAELGTVCDMGNLATDLFAMWRETHG